MESRALVMKKKKKTTGRRKIPIEKIDRKTSLQVCFSKRSRGLYKLAGDMALQCGANVAVIAFSPAGKPQSFGSPSVQEIIDSYLRHLPSARSSPSDRVPLAEPAPGQNSVPAGMQEATEMVPASAGTGSPKEPPVVASSLGDESLDMLSSMEEFLDLSPSVFRALGDEPAVEVEPQQLDDWRGDHVLAAGSERPFPIWNSRLLDTVVGSAAGRSSSFFSSLSSLSPYPTPEDEKRVWTTIDDLLQEEGCAAGIAPPHMMDDSASMDFLPWNIPPFSWFEE